MAGDPAAQLGQPGRLGVAQAGALHQLGGPAADVGRGPGGGLPDAEVQDVVAGGPARVGRGDDLHHREGGHLRPLGDLHPAILPAAVRPGHLPGAVCGYREISGTLGSGVADQNPSVRDVSISRVLTSVNP